MMILGLGKGEIITFDSKRTGRIKDGSHTSWTHDAASNLTNVHDQKSENSTISSFDYRNDNVGNRTKTVYDNANQIKYSTTIEGRMTYTFDANGSQQIVREPAGARTTTTWTYENQPTLFRMPDGSRVSMTYNAKNRRVDRE